MPHTRGNSANPFKLHGSQDANGDHSFQLEHLKQSPPGFGGVERMPRERIPQHKSLARQPDFQQRVPHHARSRFGKTAWTLLGLARAQRCNAGENVLTREQHTLRGHRDAAEMSAAIIERLADQHKPGASDALDQLRAKLLAPVRGACHRDRSPHLPANMD